jgi:hypothetical protein
MGYVLRLLLPAAAFLLLAASPAAGASARAHAAAQQHARAALEDADDLHDGRGVRTGRELTDALRELALGVRRLRGEDRRRAVSLLSRPDDGDLETPADERFTPGLPVSHDCSQNFCVHYVTLAGDAATASQAQAVLAEAEVVRAFENGTLDWRQPRNDSPLGGDRKVDIYLKELGSRNLFGWAATDPEQDTQAQHSYLVLDNDFDPDQFGGVPALDSLRVTLAHEYGHVLQYGYDVTADGWHYESSAVWLEQRMYPALDDWLRFVNDGRSGLGWRSLTELPLTAFDHMQDQPRNAKPYGSVVFNHFLTSRYGDEGEALHRRTWELSDGLARASTGAYDRAIREAQGPGLASDFAAFSAAVAEWRLPQAGFALPGQLPDVERLGTLSADGAAAVPEMDHMTFALYDVPDTSAGRIRLAASFPAGTRAAVALVAREGSIEGGQVTTQLAELPSGGTGGVTLDDPHSYIEGGGRITAVLVNADATHGPEYDLQRADWRWSRDNQVVAASLTSDRPGPAVTARSPAPDATNVGTRKPLRVTFSTDVTGVDAQSFSLRGPRGQAIPAAVTYVPGSRTATLIPTGELADTTPHTVRLTGAIVDASATSLPATEWSFTTARRGPRAALKVVSKNRSAVRFRLRSSDRDRLRWTATLTSGGRTIARRSGAIRPGAARFVAVRARGRSRARLVVVLADPQGNRARLGRALRLRR